MTTLDPRARSIPLDAAIAEAEKTGFLSIEDLQRLALSQPQAGEPVGYLVQGFDGGPFFAPDREQYDRQGHAVIPVYASPQPANPAQVTDAMVKRAIKAYRDTPEYDHHIALKNAITAAIGAGDEQPFHLVEEFDDVGAQMVVAPAIGAGSPLPEPQIEHMVQQFLRWKLPDDFNPDGGIQFVKQTDYGHTFEPVGTNLFDYKQAKALVLHMLEGLSAVGADGQAVAELRQIEEMLDAGQGDDDGPQIMPDFEPGMSTLAKVEACLFLLEKRRDVIEAFAHPAPSRQAVAVKPLEWYDPGNRIEYADTLLGSYKINASGSWWLDNGAMEHCGSREAAKAAAQADYERRILSTIAHPVQPGWREPVQDLLEAIDKVQSKPSRESIYGIYNPNSPMAKKVERVRAMLSAAPKGE
ncbi:hypothetical protein ABMA46_10065 [Mesorhizobium sp. CN5-321]|uniref:hypothetical protein n=1 Tax=Mesorhizobium hunchu TaxID=3157708 RepID=UPI0032B831B4